MDSYEKMMSALIITLIVVAYGVWHYLTTPFDDPVVYEGTITLMYGQKGKTSTGIGWDSDGDPVIVTSTTPDEFYIVLDRTHKVYVNERTWISLREGDRVRFTYYSRSRYDYEVLS